MAFSESINRIGSKFTPKRRVSCYLFSSTTDPDRISSADLKVLKMEIRYRPLIGRNKLISFREMYFNLNLSTASFVNDDLSLTRTLV